MNSYINPSAPREDNLELGDLGTHGDPADEIQTIDTITRAIDLTAEIQVSDSNPISHGGFADVYRGEWPRSDRSAVSCNGESHERGVTTQVVVKVLRAFSALDRDADLVRARKRLNREVYVWKNLEHLNIAEFYGVSFQFGGRSALVMQWYKNGAAPKYVKDRSIVSKLALVQGVGAGLEYLHSLTPPVAHGDLKGNNILVGDDGSPRLADFGLSRVIEELLAPTGNTTTTIAGSFRWQAPELHTDEADGEGQLSSSPTLPSDVWSFGCTAYELFTEKVPYFDHKVNWKVSLDVMRGVSPLQHRKVIDWPDKLVAVLNDCWALNPSERPDMTTLTSELGKVCLV